MCKMTFKGQAVCSGITDLKDVSLTEHRKLVTDRDAWCTAIHGVAKSPT